jgi:hypothetical protein
LSVVTSAPVFSSLILAVCWPMRASSISGALASVISPTTVAGPGALPLIWMLAAVNGGAPSQPRIAAAADRPAGQIALFEAAVLELGLRQRCSAQGHRRRSGCEQAFSFVDSGTRREARPRRIGWRAATTHPANAGEAGFRVASAKPETHRYNARPLRPAGHGVRPMSLDSNWFSEPHELAGSAISFRIKRKLDEEQTPFQKIEIYETTDWGNLMVIDGA